MTFDLQTYLHDTVDARRAEELKLSPQWTLGELIVCLKTLAAPSTMPVLFDFDAMYPGRFTSWRGRYAELALEPCPSNRATPPTVATLLDQCEAAVGRVFEGYKGGDFTMGRATPIWVAKWGESHVDYESENPRGLTGAALREGILVLLTAELEF